MMDIGRCGKHEEAIQNLKEEQVKLGKETAENRKEISELKEAFAKNEIRYEQIKLSLSKIESKLENRLGNRIIEKVIEYVIIFFIAYLLSGRFSSEEIKSKSSINETRRSQKESVYLHSRKDDGWCGAEFGRQGDNRS